MKGNYYKETQPNGTVQDIYENAAYKLSLARDNEGSMDVNMYCYTQDMDQMRQQLITDLVETNVKMNNLLNCISTFAEQGLIAE